MLQILAGMPDVMFITVLALSMVVCACVACAGMFMLCMWAWGCGAKYIGTYSANRHNRPVQSCMKSLDTHKWIDPQMQCTQMQCMCCLGLLCIHVVCVDPVTRASCVHYVYGRRHLDAES